MFQVGYELDSNRRYADAILGRLPSAWSRLLNAMPGSYRCSTRDAALNPLATCAAHGLADAYVIFSAPPGAPLHAIFRKPQLCQNSPPPASPRSCSPAPAHPSPSPATQPPRAGPSPAAQPAGLSPAEPPSPRAPVPAQPPGTTVPTPFARSLAPAPAGHRPPRTGPLGRRPAPAESPTNADIACGRYTWPPELSWFGGTKRVLSRRYPLNPERQLGVSRKLTGAYLEGSCG
jgi:hypothetical protein